MVAPRETGQRRRRRALAQTLQLALAPPLQPSERRTCRAGSGTTAYAPTQTRPGPILGDGKRLRGVHLIWRDVRRQGQSSRVSGFGRAFADKRRRTGLARKLHGCRSTLLRRPGLREITPRGSFPSQCLRGLVPCGRPGPSGAHTPRQRRSSSCQARS